jgi:hypothetical protein
LRGDRLRLPRRFNVGHIDARQGDHFDMLTFLALLDRFPYDPRSGSVLIGALFVLILLFLPFLAWLGTELVRSKTRDAH